MGADAEDDEYTRKLREVARQAGEAEDDADEAAHGGSSQNLPSSQNTSAEADPTLKIKYTTEEIKKFAERNARIDFKEVADNIGEESAKQPFAATGAYFPSADDGAVGTVAFCRRIRSVREGSNVMGEDTLANHDPDNKIARMLDSRVLHVLEKTLPKFKSGMVFEVAPEEHYARQVRASRRMDTWGTYHADLTPEQRWERVEELFPLNEDGSQVPLKREFFAKGNRYLDYLMMSDVIVKMVRCCIEGGISHEELISLQYAAAGVTKILPGQEATDTTVEAMGELDERRSMFNRRILRYTFPDKIAYKYNALTEDGNADILSIPATHVVAAFERAGSKITIWEHVAMYLSGHGGK